MSVTRDQLEHIIRASADVTDQYEFIIVGSQSILGAVAHPAAVFTVSTEADIYPLNAPELADRIEGALGEGSQFHETHGYYAQGVGPETAVLPAGWMTRVHRVQGPGTNQRVGYCLALVDLFLSKAAAAREKDREFCVALLAHGHVSVAEVLALVDSMPLDGAELRRLRATVRRWGQSVSGPDQAEPYQSPD
jgi:hypothetical protein